MKKYKNLIILPILFLGNITLKGMEAKDPEGPMDSTWFYNTYCVASTGNEFHQKQEWESAAHAYKNFLDNRESLLSQVKLSSSLDSIEIPKNVRVPLNTGALGTEYDEHKTKLNLAACMMALGKKSFCWTSFDKLLNIPEAKRLNYMPLEGLSNLVKEMSLSERTQVSNTDTESVLISTDLVGIGDILHFIGVVRKFINHTGYKVIVSVPQFLKDTLACASQAYEFDIVGSKDVIPETNYKTHLISLLGCLELTPAQINPEKVVFAAPERAMNAVLEQVNPYLNKGDIIAAVFLGENRQAKLIGGKKLPNDEKSYGRHLSAQAFETLLDNHPNLVVIDCGTKASKILLTKNENKLRCLEIPEEKQAFDTIVALARIMSMANNKNIIGFGADNGPTNVFVRSIDNKAQDRMALIVPNPKEYDWRMENIHGKDKGDKYTQSISNAWVYKCESPSIEHQTKTIERAYLDMTKSLSLKSKKY